MSKHYQHSKYHDTVHQIFEWICGIAALGCGIAWLWTKESNFGWTMLILFIFINLSSHSNEDEEE